MSLIDRIHFLKDVFQMTAHAFVSVINRYYINGLDLFWDTQQMYKKDLALNNPPGLICFKSHRPGLIYLQMLFSNTWHHVTVRRKMVNLNRIVCGW